MLTLLGLTAMMIGRALWELAWIQLGVDLHASTIDESKTVSKTPTNNRMHQSRRMVRFDNGEITSATW
ncbi:MAG: hypothetical protein ACK6A8_04795 [Planctomycetota bacterium]